MEEEKTEDAAPLRYVILMPMSQDPNYKGVKIDRKLTLHSDLLTSMLQDDTEDEVDELGNTIWPTIPLLEIFDHEIDVIVKIMNMLEVDPYGDVPGPLKTNNFEELVPKQYVEFLKVDDINTIYRYMSMANYLDMKKFLNLVQIYIACHIKDRDREYIKKIFKIDKEPSEEELQKVRDENMWLYGLKPEDFPDFGKPPNYYKGQ
jgi:hypothetical protein